MSLCKPSLTGLTEAEQRELMDDLNYLNMAEVKPYCRSHWIPFAIRVEGAQGKRRTEMDRKGPTPRVHNR